LRLQVRLWYRKEMVLLFHGTTTWRARRLLTNGPDPDFVEPGGKSPAENFSACLPFGPFECTDTPEAYAWGKARAAVREQRDEGGAAILIVDVPEDIIALAADAWFPLSQGFVQFDRGPSLVALLAAWPGLEKRMITFTDPRQ
jgi:hypothetical protein